MQQRTITAAQMRGINRSAILEIIRREVRRQNHDCQKIRYQSTDRHAHRGRISKRWICPSSGRDSMERRAAASPAGVQ